MVTIYNDGGHKKNIIFEKFVQTTTITIYESLNEFHPYF